MQRIPRDINGRPISPPHVQPLKDYSMVIHGRKVPAITQTRSYELITPMFGGGARTGQADKDLPIRGSSIRGQLRFWWRATQGGRFGGNLSGMREAEYLLWGAASTSKKARPSLVDVIVKVTNEGKTIGWPSFLRQTQNVGRYATVGQRLAVIDGVRFDLCLTYPKTRHKEIEATLWAWETFGGIGGRTRRGFGSLRLTAVDGKPIEHPTMQDAHYTVSDGLRTHVKEGNWVTGLPHLSPQSKMVMCQGFQRPKEAWDHLIGLLMSFRQARSTAKGRSKWPEPDEIRRLAGSVSQRSSVRPQQIRKFPRAAFGLPILFRFRDRKGPAQATLEGFPKKSDPGEKPAGLRLASPLILRPLACKDGAVGLALILDGTSVAHLPEGLRLQCDRRSYKVHALLSQEEAKQVEPLYGNPDVLEAFLDHLKKEEKR